MKKILFTFIAAALMVLGTKAQTTIIIKGSTSNPVAGQTVWINYWGIPSTCNVHDTTTTDSAGNFLYTLNLASGCNFGYVVTNIIGCQNQYDTLAASFTHDSTIKNNDTAYMNMVYCDSCKYKKAAFSVTSNGTSLLASFTNLSTPNFNTFLWRFSDGTTSTAQNPTHTYGSVGNYTVWLVATDTVWGCVDSVQRYVYIDTCGGFNDSFEHIISGYTANFFPNLKAYPFQYKLTWIFGDGTSLTNNYPSATHTYGAAGTYTVCLITQDTVNGCSDSVCKTITTASQNCSGFTANFTPTASGMSGNFTSTSSSNANLFIWNFGDSTTTIDTSKFASHIYTTAGTYTVCLIALDTVSNCTDTICKTITVGNNCSGHNANFNFSVSGTGVNFTNTSSRPWGTTAIYFWSFGDSTIDSTYNKSHTYSSPGVYQVCLTSYLTNGCISTICKNVTVSGGTCLGFTADFKTADSCGTVFFFSSSSLNANMFSWTFGNGLSSTTENPVTTYSSSGTYTACLIAKDTLLGCTDTICQSVTSTSQLSGIIYRDSGQVADSGWVYLIEMSIDSITGDTSLTAVDSTLFFYGGYYSFWNIPSGNYLIKAALAPGAAYYGNRLPTYYTQSSLWSSATSVNVNGCAYINITLLSGTNPGGSGFIGGLVSQGANKVGDPLEDVHVVLFTADGKTVAWQYTDDNGNYKFDNLAYGDYKVVVDVLGKRSEEYLVTLSEAQPSNSDGNFDVNTTSVVVVKKSATGIAPIATKQLQLYPNPATQQVNLMFEATEEAITSINIMDISGRLVQQQNIQTTKGSNTALLDVSNLQSGMYLVNIKVGDRNYISRLSVHR